jgi:hypothetical protein
MSDLEAIVAALRGHDRFLVVTHENPDGDALGSLLATTLALRRLGKDAEMVLMGEAPLPSEYHFLVNAPNYVMWEAHLVHGRGDLQGAGARVNRVLGPRAYVPELGVIDGFRGRRGSIAQAARMTWHMLRIAVKRPVDPSRLAPSQWWLDEKRGD